MSHGLYHLEPDVNNLSQLAVVVMPATQTLVGGVKQGAGIAIAADGTISATGGGQGAVASVFGRTGVVTAQAGDYTVAQVTGAAASATTITAGAGLTGGGDLSANRTFAVVPATASVLGGVKIGANVAVAADGTISVPVTSGSAFQTPWLQNVNAAGYSLSNVPSVTGNSASPGLTLAAGGAGNLILQTNALTRVSVDQNGNVGIGTTAPRYQFSVIPPTNPTTAATATQVWIGEATNNAQYGLQLGYAALGSLTGIIQSNNGGSGGPLVLNPQGGNVGIGTTVPNGLLAVTPPAAYSTIASAKNIWIGEYTNNPAYGFQIGYYSSSGNWTAFLQNVVNNAGGPLLLNPSGGNVGIGTGVPNALLEASRPHDTGPNLRLSATGINNIGQNFWMEFYDATNGSQQGAIQSGTEASYGANLQFWTKSPTGTAGSATEKMRITASGGIMLPSLPSASPGAGSKQLWYNSSTGQVMYAA